MSSKHSVVFAIVPFFALLVACSGASPDGSSPDDETKVEEPTADKATGETDNAGPTEEEAPPAEEVEAQPPHVSRLIPQKAPEGLGSPDGVSYVIPRKAPGGVNRAGVASPR